MSLYLGIDIGGTNIKITAIDDNLASVGFDITKTPQGDIQPALRELIKSFISLNRIDVSDVITTGIGVPGIIKDDTGPVVYTPNMSLTGVDLRKTVADILSDVSGSEYDVSNIYIGNDANCAGIAEAVTGAGKGHDIVMLLTLGTGVGGCVIQNGMPMPFGKYGGEFGHFPFKYEGKQCSCGIRGCFEQYANAKAFYEFGFDKYTEYLAAGIAGLVNIFRPDIVLLAGGVANEGEALSAAVNKNMISVAYARDHIDPPTVALASLGSVAGAVGAAILGKNKGSSS